MENFAFSPAAVDSLQKLMDILLFKAAKPEAYWGPLSYPEAELVRYGRATLALHNPTFKGTMH